MLRFQVPLTAEENRALLHLAQRERRPVRMQAALLIRAQLIALGVLQPDEPTERASTGVHVTQEMQHGRPPQAA